METNTSKGHIPIKKSEYIQHTGRINQKLKSVEWIPKKDHASKMLTTSQGSANADAGFISGPAIEVNKKDVVKIIPIVESICKDEHLLDVDAVFSMDSVRTGFLIGMRVFELYCQSSGLDHLINLNTAGRLTESDKAVFQKQMQTGAFVSLFVTSSYVRWKLSNYKSDKISSIELPFAGIPEINLTTTFTATDCVLYYYGFCLQQGEIVRDTMSLVKFTLIYFENVLDELAKRVDAIEYKDFFTNSSYKLEDEEFVIDGFKESTSVIAVSCEYNRVSFDSIVGNDEAIHEARRKAQRLGCYDPKLKMNPWHEMKGLASISLGYGDPGTGKSLIIAATATLLHEYCDKLGVPFLFHPFPDNIVSTYQGGSAERMMAWMKVLHSPSSVIYAPIDDGENNLENRSRQGVSSGVREVVSVFLRYTEGAYAINHGNWAIDLMTNLPEQIDPAVMSRIQSRFPIKGAMTVEDFVDQDFLWWKKLAEVNPEFVDIVSASGYEFMSAQKKLSSLIEIETGEVAIEDPRILEIVEEIRKNHEICEAEFFGKLYTMIRRIIPRFSSRDLRNIQSAVNIRAMDFDMPDEFFEDRSLFFDRSFDDRMMILRGLMSENVKGMKLSDVIYREAIAYLSNAAKIGSVDDERQITEMLKRGENRQEAMKRAAEMGITPQLVY